MAFFRGSILRSRQASFGGISSNLISTREIAFASVRHKREFTGSRMGEQSELFEYTSGRWMINDSLRHIERRRTFNVSEFKRHAAASVGRNAEDVAGFEKLVEGGYNRTFLITMRDGFKFVGRIPYASTEPKGLVIGSEVATLDYLRSHGIPVPRVYGYSISAKNSAGTEYIFMEFVEGINLGDIWFELPEKARIAAVTNLVRLEAKLFELRFPASRSLYYAKDLPADARKSSVTLAGSGSPDHHFCIGPETTLSLWYGKRHGLQVDRGPYTDPTAVLEAGAKKELAYLAKFGRPLHPLQRVRREIYDYQKQSHLEHVDNLNKYLQIVPHIAPNVQELTRPILRHPDLQPNNVLVSNDLQMTGLIDWQHCAILPLFLQCGIPNSLQNYGDSVSESLEKPELPASFDDMSESSQFQEVLLLRRRQLHCYYVAQTARLNPTHYDAMCYDYSTLRRKLFNHAGSPWEGDSTTLKSDLIHLTNAWPAITRVDTESDAHQPVSCPISFPDDEAEACLSLARKQDEADEQLQACMDAIGVGSEGRVSSDMFAETQQREKQLKADTLAAAESEKDRNLVDTHWIFDDFDEDE